MSTEPQPKKQKRFTAQRKQEIVLRLLKGEPIEMLSRELSVLRNVTSDRPHHVVVVPLFHDQR